MGEPDFPHLIEVDEGARLVRIDTGHSELQRSLGKAAAPQ